LSRWDKFCWLVKDGNEYKSSEQLWSVDQQWRRILLYLRMHYNRQLDEALRFLDKYNRGSYVYYDRDSNEMHINNKENPVEGKKDQLYWHFENENIELKYWWPIIDHLIGDGYVKPHFEKDKPESDGNKPHQIKITYKGTAFINKFMGGYVWQSKGKFITTSLTVVATIVGVIWILFQLLEKFKHCLHGLTGI
jgi:hypothetical protein